jgi:hypothetical protein
MTVVHTEWHGLDSADNELERLTNIFRIVGRLEEILSEQFLHSQALVSTKAHPHTPTYVPRDRLVASGHTHSQLRGTDAWVGEVIYDAVNEQGTGYAIFEYQRRKDDPIHGAFMDELVNFDTRYTDAIDAWFRGDLG